LCFFGSEKSFSLRNISEIFSPSNDLSAIFHR
jgi:hypothetical protein